MTDLLVRTIVITGSDVVPVKDLAQRSSLSRGSIRSSLRSLNQHGIVVRASRTCWSVPPDLFVRLDDVATRLGLDRVRELRRLDHQAEREDHWERLILHTFMSSADVRRAIKRLGYKVPEHLVSLRSIQEQAEDRGREEAPARAGRVPEPGLVPDRDVLDRETRPTRRYVIRRPPPVEVDLRPCILDLVRLQQRIDGIAENGATSSAITKMITDLIVELAREQGLRVRREVVVPVYREVGRRIRRTWRQRVDLVLTMPGKPPLYVEIDRAEKRESRRKLQWAVSQGHDALWVRWAGLNEVAVVDDGVRVVEPSWRGMRRRVRELTTLLDAS